MRTNERRRARRLYLGISSLALAGALALPTPAAPAPDRNVVPTASLTALQTILRAFGHTAGEKLPDLVVSSVANPPATAQLGQSFTVATAVKNVGRKTA